MKRVFIVGWDGATFDLIKPWVAEGKLPNIAETLRMGTSGELQSTLPATTFPAWTSFMTGMNPGKHGVYDFMRQRPGTYHLEFVNGGHRRTPTFWKILSDAGRKVISISVPCTFPPEEVDGIMLSGFDAPGMGGRGSQLGARGMYPSELHAELLEKVGGHPVASFPMQEINRGQPELAIDRIIEPIREKVATTKYLMKNKSWDCMMVMFGESDGVGHQFWRYCDPESPLFTASGQRLRDSMLTVYEELDRQLGELKAMLPEDVTLIMMSDHGFGGVSNCALYPNRFLHERGFVSFRGRATRWSDRLLERVKLHAVNLLPSKLKRLLHRIVGARLGSIESRIRYGMIDWKNTQAVFEENPYHPHVWINLKGRQPEGTVHPGQEFEEVRDKIIEALEDWQHPETGEKIVKKAYRREEVYSGPCLDEAPDIVIQWAEHKGYSYAFTLSSKSPDSKWWSYSDGTLPDELAYFTGTSGSHRERGIFLAQGNGIQEGLTIDGARIVDVAPTILHLLSVPIPEDMDGRPLRQIFSDEYSDRELELAPAAGSSGTEDIVEYSEQDEERIRDRLRSLGYLS